MITINDRELLGEGTSSSPVPEARTPEYYERRPCIDLVGDAAKIMEEYICSHHQEEEHSCGEHS